MSDKQTENKPAESGSGVKHDKHNKDASRRIKGATRNERADPGSGVTHNKFAPASKKDIKDAKKADKAAKEKTARLAALAEKNAADAAELEPEDDTPTEDNTKAEILDWCDAQNIDVESGMTKAELLESITELLENE